MKLSRQEQKEIDKRERRISNQTMINMPKNKIPANLYSCQEAAAKISIQVNEFIARGGKIDVVDSVMIAQPKVTMDHYEELGV